MIYKRMPSDGFCGIINEEKDMNSKIVKKYL